MSDLDRPYALVRQHEASGAVYVSGAAALDDAGRPIPVGAAAVDTAFEVVLERLRSVGLGAAALVQTTWYLTDMGLRADVDGLFRRRLAELSVARSVVGAASLPLGACVLVDAIAYRTA